MLSIIKHPSMVKYDTDRITTARQSDNTTDNQAAIASGVDNEDGSILLSIQYAQPGYFLSFRSLDAVAINNSASAAWRVCFLDSTEIFVVSSKPIGTRG
jgi:hypothetical protein